MLCNHPDFAFHVDVNKLGDTNLVYAEVKGRCLICGEAVHFRSTSRGMSPNEPRTGLDPRSIILPCIVGPGEWDGKGGAGYTIHGYSGISNEN